MATPATFALDRTVRSLHAGRLSAAREHMAELERLRPGEVGIAGLRRELDERVAKGEKDLTPTPRDAFIVGLVAAA